MSKQLTKQKGFTIVEVLIVLAIAGVIMLVVFLAVPTLQRNSRNTQRRADVSHLAGVINEWIANHQGTTLTKVSDTTAVAGPSLASEKFAVVTGNTADGTAVTVSANPWVAPGSAALDTFYVYSSATCASTGAAPTYSTSVKSYVVYYLVEPGTTAQCASI